ncbi:SCP-like protein [Ancylostoma caninum]|uniref:SCP-like protein n=1 Tax=Ancylostoma caninum TaxID=29170 RepID=A0A368GK23_ANCCA|nr:SCP-like protein [Ancylostoma caninum]
MGPTLAIIILLSVEAVGAAPDYQCWNFKSTDEIRYQYLSTVNNLRKQIAEGVADNKQGKCPQGKNIHKLGWDCLLEMEAQKVVDQCKIDAKAPNVLSMLIEKVHLTTCNPTSLFKTTVKKAWWDVVTQEGIGSGAIFNNEKLRSFATLAHGKATRIGCAQKNCNGDLYMACMVYEK